MRQIGDILKEHNIRLETLDPVAQGGFTQVPNFILKKPELSVGAKVAYAMFLSYAWHNDSCFPGQDRLAEDMGMTRPRVTQLISELQAAGLVSIQRRGQGKTNLYTIHFQVKPAVDRTPRGKQAYLKNRSDWGKETLFGIQPEDARHHTYLIGKTGSGKTTLLRNMILQHLANGSGLALLDPHGDLADELLDHYPPSRADDLVYFNPSDLDFPIGLNLLANVAPEDRHLVASGITAAFKSIWRDSWGPRMEYILYNALAALLDCQNTSLLGVNRMLTDASYRAWVIRQIDDPFIRSFWADEFAGYDPRFVREAIAPIQNKIGQFLMNPPIRNILGQVKSKIDFRYMMDTGRVFIANLSKGKLGADKANLLGSLLTTQFQLAAMSRADTPESERRDFHLFIDEFHNFTTDSFAAILAEARKYRLCLTLSHQYIDQLSLPVRQAVFGNAGTIIAFRIGHTDAELLAKEFANTFIPGQFVDLSRYEILIRLLENAVATTPFSAKTLSALANRHPRRQKLIQHSRERYSTSRGSIETKLNRWLDCDILRFSASR